MPKMISIDASLAQQVLDAQVALREWIKAVPQDTPLPAMPGIDSDWLDELEANVREALAAGPLTDEFDVRKILRDVVPGDGSGHEVFFKNTSEVVSTLTKMSEQIEAYEIVQTPEEKGYVALSDDGTHVFIDGFGEVALAYPPMRPQPVEKQTLDPLAERTTLDAIRGAYDLGYKDRSASADADQAGYKGDDVERDHGGALLARLNQIVAKPQPLADAFEITRYTLGNVNIEQAAQLKGPAKWAVRKFGNCLAKDGEWELEPLPSSRDDAFLERCRFDTAEEALDAAAADQTYSLLIDLGWTLVPGRPAHARLDQFDVTATVDLVDTEFAQLRGECFSGGQNVLSDCAVLIRRNAPADVRKSLVTAFSRNVEGAVASLQVRDKSNRPTQS